ncbi:MAG: iron ABC transporter permease [Azoarcus sp.]|jgi:iron(III) transport system permease protein|nr:iron ABC transporter permease [Azoarcus sp.]
MSNALVANMSLHRGAGFSPRRFARLPLYAALFFVLVWPVIMLIAGSFRSAAPGFDGEWTLAAWGSTFDSPGTGQAMSNSLFLSLVTTLLSTLIAAGLAFLSERTDMPLRRAITPCLMLMFATPALFYALGYALLGNAYTGSANSLLRTLFGVAAARLDVETWTGLITVMVLKKASIIYLFLIGPFRALDSSHNDASLVSGVGQFGSFFRIDLPTLTPALTGAILLGIVAGLQAFDMVLILGWPQDIDVIATRIMSFINGSAPPDYARASVLSIVLLAVVAILCIVQSRLLGKRSFVTVAGKRNSQRRVRLGRARWPLAAAVAFYLLLAVILPIGSVVFSSFQPFPGIYEGFSLRHYRSIFALPRMTDAIRVTFSIALIAGFAAMLFAVAVAQLGRALPPRRAAALRFVSLIPLAMPGVVTALAISWAVVSMPGLKQLYGTFWLVTLALVVVVVPFAIQVANAATAQISPELQEAARIAGASAPQATMDVVLRLIAPSFLSGWFMAAIIVSGNLEVPLLLKAPGLNPIATVVYSLYSSGDFSAASALLVILLLVKAAIWGTALAGYRLWRAWRQYRRQRLLSEIAIWREEASAPVSRAVTATATIAG